MTQPRVGDATLPPPHASDLKEPASQSLDSPRPLSIPADAYHGDARPDAHQADAARADAHQADAARPDPHQADAAYPDAHTFVPAAPPGEVPRRMLGRTGVEVSAIGLGGSHLGQTSSEKEAIRIVHEAIDAGITFMDNAWEYHRGKSETRLGRALKGRRDKAFLMTKVCTHGRGKAVAMRMLEDSLKRLQTDYLDLWQIHEVIYDNDPRLIFSEGGAIEALTLAKEQGKVRFIGFTGHKDPAIHLEMLSHHFPFDTCQMPLNCFDGLFRSFERQVLLEVNRQGIAPIGMKSMGGSGEAVLKHVVTATEALRYAMSLPVATTVSGIDSLEVLHQNLKIVLGFQPMTVGEMRALRMRCAREAEDGRFELYKTSGRYDATEGRQQHGFPPK